MPGNRRRDVLTTSLREAAAVAREHFGTPVEDFLPDFSLNYPRLQKTLSESPGYARVEMPVIDPGDLEDFREKLLRGDFPLRTATGVPAKYVQVPAGNLRPTQKEVWLDKIFGAIAKQGPPCSGSLVLRTPVIVSAELNLVDGHHRWAQVFLKNPDLEMNALQIVLPIQRLLEVGVLYSDEVGNVRKQGRGPMIRLASKLPAGCSDRRRLLEALRRG